MPIWVIMVEQGEQARYFGKNGKLVDNRSAAWNCKKESTESKKATKVEAQFPKYKVYILEL